MEAQISIAVVLNHNFCILVPSGVKNDACLQVIHYLGLIAMTNGPIEMKL